MSDITSIAAKTTTPFNNPQDLPLKAENNTQFKQNNDFEQKAVILSVDTSNIQRGEKRPVEKGQEQEIKEPLLKDVRTVSVSYDKSGVPIVKFLDSKGNTVLQVPPEEYLRMKEKAAEEDSNKIPDIVNKKV